MAFRWTPAEKNSRKGFELAEVSAFGDMPLSMLSTSELPDVYADNSMGLMSPPSSRSRRGFRWSARRGVGLHNRADGLRDRFRRLAKIVQA